MITATSTKKD